MTAPTQTSGAEPRPQPAAPREYHFPSFTRQTLANGVQLLIAPASKLPVVTVLALVDAGASLEVRGKEGVAALTARLLQEGTATLSGSELADRFERIGASVEAHGDWDVTVTSLTTLSANLENAASLLRDMMRSPSFPEREVSRVRDERLADLLQQQTEPRTLADDRFSEAVYEGNSRYARPEAGDAASVRGISRDDILTFHATHYVPSATTLIFAGDVEPDAAKRLAERLFGDWSVPAQPRHATAVDVAQEGRLVRIVAKADAPQSEVRVGHRGLPRNVSDYFETTVMNAILGGLFSSRINMNLREAHGYTYGASSLFEWRRGYGPFEVSTAVKSEVTGEAVKEILYEIDRMRTEEIGDDELTLATSYLDGVFPIRYETTAAIATALANMVIFGLPEDYYNTYRARVRAVTTKHVLEAAQRHLDPEAMRIVVVGDPAVIRESLERVTGLPVEITRADDEAAS